MWNVRRAKKEGSLFISRLVSHIISFYFLSLSPPPSCINWIVICVSFIWLFYTCVSVTKSKGCRCFTLFFFLTNGCLNECTVHSSHCELQWTHSSPPRLLVSGMCRICPFAFAPLEWIWSENIICSVIFSLLQVEREREKKNQDVMSLFSLSLLVASLEKRERERDAAQGCSSWAYLPCDCTVHVDVDGDEDVLLPVWPHSSPDAWHIESDFDGISWFPLHPCLSRSPWVCECVCLLAIEESMWHAY